MKTFNKSLSLSRLKNRELWARHLEKLELNRQRYFQDVVLRDRLNCETENLLTLEVLV